MIKKLGLQLFTIRDSMKDAETIRESFRRMKELGYDVAQTAGCSIPYDEFGRIAAEEGIEICGTHDNFNMMYEDTEKAIALHKALGSVHMGMSGFKIVDADAVAQFIEKANKVANIIYEHGFKFTYHNHGHEFITLANGKTSMDMLVEGLDPVKTSFCLDTYWVQNAGGDVRHWIEKLSGRIDILHLKDMGRNAEGPFITEIGNGNMWWEGIIASAEKAGVEYYVVEQDQCPGDQFESVAKSSEYIHQNFMI